ncbi:MAG: hypothetical protein RJA07_1536 [Bacteroidota bacterium]|jgi:GDP/UDP-N,N'-diacetylbacillosamine 2-epimerase (hydrolysing)
MPNKQTNKIKICIVTGSRAEYGLLKPLIKLMIKDNDFDVKVVATASHLEKRFGYTYKEIEKDNISIHQKINISIGETSADNINQSFSKCVSKFSTYFVENKPNYLLILGDRYEMLAIAIAAYIHQIPIAHINGGEATSGTMDEGFRHSISKLSSLHFPSTENYRQRLIQLGENPTTVFNVGVLSVDNIKNFKLLLKNELESSINFKFTYPTAIITFHPVPLDKKSSINQLKDILNALNSFPNLSLLFTKSNADIDGNKLNELIKEFVSKRKNAILIDSLGMQRFLSSLKYVDIMIGNSSAGIVEMPYFKKPTINIGERQSGRLKAQSIIDCSADKKEIVKAIEKSLMPKFLKSCENVESIFGDGKASEKIIKQLKLNFGKINLKKEFYDLPKIKKDK